MTARDRGRPGGTSTWGVAWSRGSGGRTRRSGGAVALVATVALLSAACQTSSGSDGAPTERTTSASAEAPDHEPPPVPDRPSADDPPSGTDPSDPGTPDPTGSDTDDDHDRATDGADAGPDADADAGPDPDAGTDADTGRDLVEIAEPVRVALDPIEVVADVIPLDIRDDGTIEVPPDGVDAGWYRHGARPGEPGPTVIGAHVDWSGEPGVFADLHHLEVGDVVTVTDADGQEVDYRVDGLEQHEKADFPTFDVYGATPGDTLRLVTCAGPFDQQARSHRDNLVVFATAR
jgi:LPXTG-site transpeptidase (sortase) family protein